MKTNSVEVTLQSTHDYKGTKHSFNISVQDGTLLLTTPQGREIAQLSVQTYWDQKYHQTFTHLL